MRIFICCVFFACIFSVLLYPHIALHFQKVCTKQVGFDNQDTKYITRCILLYICIRKINNSNNQRSNQKFISNRNSIELCSFYTLLVRFFLNLTFCVVFVLFDSVLFELVYGLVRFFLSISSICCIPWESNSNYNSVLSINVYFENLLSCWTCVRVFIAKTVLCFLWNQ